MSKKTLSKCQEPKKLDKIDSDQQQNQPIPEARDQSLEGTRKFLGNPNAYENLVINRIYCDHQTS